MMRSPGVSERRVSEIVAERNRFGQLLVQAQHLRDGAGDLRNLERVGQPRAVVIARRREEDLRLVLQAAEGLAVDDAIAIPLKRRAHVVFGLRPKAAARVAALRRLRREDLELARLELLADGSRRVLVFLKAGFNGRSPSAGRRAARLTAAMVAGDSPGPSNQARLGSLRNQIN